MADYAPRFIIDAHEDLAWNMNAFDRDYTLNVAALRERERGKPVIKRTGTTLLGKDAWLAGRVAVIFSTLFAAPVQFRLGEWDTQSYVDARSAYDLYSKQIDTYLRLVEVDETFYLIETQSDLKNGLATWDDQGADLESRRIGLLILMEGADGIMEPPQVEEWYERGVRIIGPAWKETRYAGGTGQPGPLTALGFELLAGMQDLNMVLDLSHLAEEAYFQAVEAYQGPIIASHSNPRRFFPDPIKDRGLSDEMLVVAAERDAVIGVVPFNSFLNPEGHRTDPKDSVSLQALVAAIDYICQVTGSARHVAIGTDFDGGFGWERTPAEINTVADLHKLVPLLLEAGYNHDQIDGFMYGNWLRVLQNALPD